MTPPPDASPLPPDVDAARLIVGMEIHVELATRAKLFTRTPNPAHPDHYDAAVNTLTDPVVAALPGALPVLNRAAVELSIMVGLALNCRIAARTRWDRKNYFYPDLPKGYQISQYDLPLCTDGVLEIETGDGESRRIGIIRAHLEEDTGKLGHELPGGGYSENSLIDLNRAGAPLLEIVTQPDLRSADEAVTFAQSLRRICRFLNATEGVMQRGQMRFEPNVNVCITTDDGREYHTPIVEVKNLNSFKAIHGAVEYEYTRQIAQWREDGRTQGPGMKSTRGWDDEKQATVLQREKEDAHDYRYFPEPDLPELTIEPEQLERLQAMIPELPAARRQRYLNDLGLSPADADALLDERETCFYFEACAERCQSMLGLSPAPAARDVAKLLLNAGARLANERGVRIDQLGVRADQVAQLIGLRADDEVGSSAADELFARLCDDDGDARDVAEAHGLLQVRDEGQLDAWIDAAIEADPTSAEDFAGGKDAAVGRLIGGVMKLSNGQADAKAVREKFVARLRS